MKQNPRISSTYGIVNKNVITDPSLNFGQKAMYAYLCTYADQNNELHVSINRIAAECDVGHSTVKRILDQLLKKGIISRERRGAGQSFKTILLK
jgi:DNA-binding MarR family transcriptional regulator